MAVAMLYAFQTKFGNLSSPSNCGTIPVDDAIALITGAIGLDDAEDYFAEWANGRNMPYALLEGLEAIVMGDLGAALAAPSLEQCLEALKTGERFGVMLEDSEVGFGSSGNEAKLACIDLQDGGSDDTW